MRIEILCTGDEILSGKTINTNYGHIARRLIEEGLDPVWGTTVGDDRATLMAAFKQAASRADAVIVNGGLGPTVDDLSQEVAAEAAGVGLELHEAWLARMEAFYARRNRVMPPNNRKQAMLPAGAEFVDNPIGTACGFAVTIGKARFIFTPGVPREMRRMVDEQVIPRLLAMAGVKGVTRPSGAIASMSLSMLSARGDDTASLDAMLAPIEAEVRRRLGNFVVAEDTQSLEGVVLDALRARGGTLAVAETLTGGNIAARLAPGAGAETVFRRGIVSRDLSQLAAGCGADPTAAAGGVSDALAIALADALRKASGASHALVSLVQLDDAPDTPDLGGHVVVGIAGAGATVARPARLVGGRDWVRIGAAELALDCLRRALLGLPVDERVDFERR